MPPGAAAVFSRRDNANYMETGILSGLQITATFPNLILENFYTKTKHSIDAGTTQAPYGYVIMPNRDITRLATLIGILRMQGIEVGQLSADLKVGGDTYPAGAYVVKNNQPYGRLARTLLEKQIFPDASLQTYDDSGWTQGLATLNDVRDVNDKAILDAKVTAIAEFNAKGKVSGAGTAGLAVAHYGSNNMISFRYKLKNVPMKIAEKSFTVDGTELPAGSFVITDAASMTAAKAAVEEFGLTAVALSAAPTVPMHDADVPRIAIYSQWSNTQELGWYRYTFDRLGIPYDLIFKEQIKPGNLRAKYDVIIMAAQQVGRAQVMQGPAARPVPYLQTDKYKFLGMYGSSPDITGGFGQQGVDEFGKFLEGGGTLILTSTAVSFATEFGFAHTVDATDRTSGQFYAPRPIIKSEIVRPDHPTFYGYSSTMLPLKYLAGPLLKVGIPDQGTVLARYVGGPGSVLSGFMRGVEEIANRPFAIDIPDAYKGKGRVLLFANNPIYRWQNFGEFNMVFNSIMNWNDMPGAAPVATPAGGGRGGGQRH